MIRGRSIQGGSPFLIDHRPRFSARHSVAHGAPSAGARRGAVLRHQRALAIARARILAARHGARRKKIPLDQPDPRVAGAVKQAISAVADAIPVVGPALDAIVSPLITAAFTDTYAPIDDVNSDLFQRGGRGNESAARTRTSGGTRVLRE